MQPQEQTPDNNQAVNTPVAGWYPDPAKGTGDPGHLRYWDGHQWTNHVHSPEEKQQPANNATGLAEVTAAQNPQSAVAVRSPSPSRAKNTSILTSHPEIDKYPAFLIGAILWAAAGLWGFIAPVAARIMQTNAINSQFEMNGYSLTPEERMFGQALGTLTNAAANWATGPLFAFWGFIAFCALIGYGFIVFFLVKGSTNARIIGTVLTGVSLIPLLITGVPGIIQIALNAGGLVLVWRRSSTEYLNAAAQRTQAKKAGKR